MATNRSKGLLIDRATVLYIAGPLTPSKMFPSQESNCQKAMLCGLRWWRRGYSVLIPHLNTKGFECFGVKYNDFIALSLSLIHHSDGIVMMQGWQYSNGAVTEHDYATTNGLPVFYDEEFEKYNRKE